MSEDTADLNAPSCGLGSENEWRNILKDKYVKAETLLEGSSKDPVSHPYKSKYEARELLRELAEILRVEPKSSDNKSLNDNEIKVMLVAVLVMIANVDIEVDEEASAQTNLEEGLSLLDVVPLCPLNVTVTISALNQLGLLWSTRGDHEKALEYLEKAETFYKMFIQAGDDPVDVKTLFTRSNENNGKVQLEKLYTHSLYYLAQVFKSLQMDEKSALYCHSTLKRQIEPQFELNKIEWAVNSATLSQYLAEKYAFKEARHHLAAAEYFMQAEEKRLNDMNQESEEYTKLKETIDHRSSDVARCWVKYCLLLFCTSRDRLMGTSSEDHGDPPPVPSKELVGLCFPNIDLKEQEKLVTSAFVLDYDDAKEVFLFGQKCCNKALQYNTLDGHVSDHVSITEDLSQLYRLLAFYEENEDSQSKMHKRRYDLLSKVVNALNPQYYLDLCRGLWMELGIICLAIAEIKLMKINAVKTAETKAVVKCNTLIQSGIDYIEKYIHSYDDKKKQAPPDRYPEHAEKDVLSAHLLTANMYMKFLTADNVKLLYYNSKSLDLYKTVITYCKRHPEFKELADEQRLAEEMALLLPAKLARINSRINSE